MKYGKLAVVLAASVAVTAAVAQDDANKEADGASSAAKVSAKASFTTLPLCRYVEGDAEARLPNGEWQPAEEGKFYPLGTSFRTRKRERLVLAFGADSSATIEGEASFGTRQQGLGSASRTVTLGYGTLQLKLASNLPEGAFFVAAPDFVVNNPAGESRYVFEDKGDGCKTTVRCVTGVLGMKGRHFEIPCMRAADEVVVRSDHDHLTTILYGTSGDYVLKLDQGLCAHDDIGDDGSVKRVAEKRVIDWRLSPATRVVINRAKPAIGENMSVHTMAFDAAGTLKSECSFCEGRAEVNSGELVAKEKVEGEELVKRAAEATETTAAADVEDAPAGESGNNNKDNSNQE